MNQLFEKIMKEKQIEITVLISEIEHLEYMHPCCSKSNIRRNEGFTIYIYLYKYVGGDGIVFFS